MAYQLQAVIFDWAGTIVDYGSFAPIFALIEGFKAHGVEITFDEARGPMGKYKRDHIADILYAARVAGSWETVHGHAPTDADVQKLFDDFIPLQREVIAKHSDPIEGVLEVVADIRARGLKIGSCTGYSREMMELLTPIATQKGYTPDALVTPDEVGHGRPAPFMLYENARRLGVYPMWRIVKVGDAIADIEEGRNAGVWTVAIAMTGNELGLTHAEVKTLTPNDLEARLIPIRQRLFENGAHYVIDSVADLIQALDAIELRLSMGERP